MQTIQEVNEQIRQQLMGKLSSARRLSLEEYEAAKRKVEAANYKGICRPDCEICQGAGYIKVNPSAGIHDPEFGQMKVCPNVDPAKLYSQGMGLDENEIRTLEWKHIKNKSNVSAGVNAVKEVLIKGYGWVTLYGGYGLAKSLILRIAVAESLRAGKMAAFVEMAGLLDDLRQAFDSKDPSGESIARLQKWQDMPILAIDEIEKINNTPWADERQFAMLNHRYQMAIREKSITILASNKPPKQIGGPLGDRMEDGRFKVVELKGASNRPIMADGQDY